MKTMKEMWNEWKDFAGVLGISGTLIGGLIIPNMGEDVLLEGILLEPPMSSDAVRAEPAEGRSYISFKVGDKIYTPTVFEKDLAKVKNLPTDKPYILHMFERPFGLDTFEGILPDYE